MSTQYLLTIVSDVSNDLIKYINKLKKQDSECTKWSSEDISKLIELLRSLKGNAETRRSEIIREKGNDPEDYPF